MTARTEAIAQLVKQQIEQKFGAGDQGSKIRVTCLQKPGEIIALVDALRGWRSPSGANVRVAVTADGVWDGLREADVVPKGEETATTLRNKKGLAVVLIEGDAYSDRQSWQTVRPISDTSLLDEPAARSSLVRHFYGTSVPGLLFGVLEEVHESVRGGGATDVNVRQWIALVEAICEQLDPSAPLDAPGVWKAVGFALPMIGLLSDDSLASFSETDRRRRLQKNRDDMHRLFFEADDRWRDDLQGRVPDVVFRDPHDEIESDQKGIRHALASLLGADGSRSLASVRFRHWRQLTDHKNERRGLGTRIRDHLSAAHRERLGDYDALDVVDGIDNGNADDAQKLLDDLPHEDGVPPLVTLLTTRQVSALERMANPRAPSTRSPLAEVLRGASDMVSERAALLEDDERPEAAHLVLEPRRSPDEARHSAALFAWLFGATLGQVMETLSDDLVSMQVDPSLLDSSPLANFEQESRSEEEGPDGNFGALEIRMRWSDGVGRERHIEWKPRETPGLAALWRLTTYPDAIQWHLSSDVDFDDWLVSCLQWLPLVGPLPAPEGVSGPVSHWLDERGDFLRLLALEGLQPVKMRGYSERFAERLVELRDIYPPVGAPRPEVAGVLDCDLVVERRGLTMLATHPIRLRWIANYLDRLGALLCQALRSDLVTNPINPELFYSELLALSPQGQPPVAVLGDRLHVAVREQDWHERFALLRDERGERREWLADLDDGAIDEVADIIGRYLDAYPHKADGLHILYIVRERGARGMQRLVSRVMRQVKVRGATLTLTLFVDPREVRAVEEALQEFDDADHRAHSDRPPIAVVLRHWENPQEKLPDLDAVDPIVDIAVVPNLFGASTRTHDGTRDARLENGTFDPLLDQPTRLEGVGRGESLSTAVSRVLLPEGRDALLETWSTVTTRQFRGSPVGDSPREHDVDHVTIQVSLEKNRRFFDALHACSHWVVTVDAFVGREQVEALAGGPEVIRVKTGVGANGAYRMVVSSGTGRDFVESRVARRLAQQIPSSALPDVAPLATAVYDRARLLVPGIVLRSLGLGRTAAEMVGLVLARQRVEQRNPAVVGSHGFQAWLSLDEHPEWSGGHQAPRADLARVIGRFEGGAVHLSVEVIEAKMRTQVAVGRADRQISRSITLLKGALNHRESDGDSGYVDSPMWRRLIWRAIEQTSTAPDATPAATHVVKDGTPLAGLDGRLRGALRQGDVVLESITGVLVSMTEADVGTDAMTPEGHRWLKVTLDEAKDLLRGLGDVPVYPLRMEQGPQPPAPATEERRHEEPTNRGDEVQTPARPARAGATEKARQRMQDLLDALYKHDLDLSPEGTDADALEGPGFYLLRVRLGRGVRPQTLFSLSDDLQYHLRLDAGRSPRMYVDRGAVVVEVPKREEERFYVEARPLWGITVWPTDRLYAPLGVDVRGEPVGIDFSSNNSPHLLIGGMTGGGKSVALETLLMGMVEHYPAERLELRVVDPKGNEFTQFEDFPHLVEPPGMDAEDAIEMLSRTCDEMDARYRAMKDLSRSLKKRVPDIAAYNESVQPGERFRWVVVVLDEFADLTSGKEDKKTIEGLLQRLSQKARACGIHVIAATQKPSSEVISTTIRSNLGAQLALRVRSAIDSKIIMEAAGAESLAGNGDAFLRLSGQEPIRLQCARVTP